MKKRYDQKVVVGTFQAGDKVMVLPFACFSGEYAVEK